MEAPWSESACADPRFYRPKKRVQVVNDFTLMRNRVIQLVLKADCKGQLIQMLVKALRVTKKTKPEKNGCWVKSQASAQNAIQ